MGGGGGVFGGGHTPDDYKEVVRETKAETSDAKYETTVNDIINETLSGAARDPQVTRERLDDIRDALKEDEIGTLDLLLGGSVKKHTYVDGLSDVDVLLCVNRTDLSNASPREVLEYVRDRICERNIRGIDSVTVGELAITVKYSNGEEIQLLPSIRTSTGFKIPKRGTKEWSNVIKPDKFAEKLTKVNQQNGNKVVPVIKLAKAIMSLFPPDQQPSGYHIESMAIEIFKSYPDGAPRTTKAMLEHFFERGKDVVKKPIKDNTGQSVHVDDDLGAANSSERAKISYIMDRVSRRMKDANQVGDADSWKSILGE